MLLQRNFSYEGSSLYSKCSPLRVSDGEIQRQTSINIPDINLRKNYLEQILPSRTEDEDILLSMDCCSSIDIIDHPYTNVHPRVFSKNQQKYLATMKYEANRLRSYKDKWPLEYVKPKELAEAGLFYLQTEAKVQCAFCGVIISNWVVGDKPLREHVRSSSLCKFLLGESVGNIPIKGDSPSWMASKLTPAKLNPYKLGDSYARYKPKHPAMADLRRRLMTYKDWPLTMLKPKDLADCGLYYTGVADVVTCFFCGGTLANFELEDDPWTEHSKYFPKCAFVELHKGNRLLTTTEKKQAASNFNILPKFGQASIIQPSTNSIVLEAMKIFPGSIVQTVVADHFRQTGKNFESTEELCEEILARQPPGDSECGTSQQVLPEKHQILSALRNETQISTPSETSTLSTKRENLMCKICLDEEMSVVFQPCAHLVACSGCANVVDVCPLCRTLITDRFKIYVG